MLAHIDQAPFELDQFRLLNVFMSRPLLQLLIRKEFSVRCFAAAH